jgi:peptidoglycan/xylan/chitin deacetylase (PgdA/CDA1 family)
MYHEFEMPGRPLCGRDQGYARYALPTESFESQMKWLKSEGWYGASVGEWLAGNEQRGVVVTFDDGCETDLLVAAEVLGRFGFKATFYVVSQFLGRQGYLSADQVRQLSRAGFEIGCHSRTHSYLANLDSRRVYEEIVVAKAELEQVLARSVQHFSCPGGRWSREVARIAKDAGYASVASSRIGTNGRFDNLFHLSRVALQRDISLPEFQKLCRAERLWARRSAYFFMQSAKMLLGDSLYDSVRSIILRDV